MCPPCLAPVQPQGSHPHVTLPGPQRCPCWHWVGYVHQSGIVPSSTQLFEHKIAFFSRADPQLGSLTRGGMAHLTWGLQPWGLQRHQAERDPARRP